jgi:hypothetical protein
MNSKLAFFNIKTNSNFDSIVSKSGEVKPKFRGNFYIGLTEKPQN